MAFLNVKNRAISTLAADITATATSLNVAAGEGDKFPASNFHITIDDEILLCTSRSVDTFTVTRAQEGTTAAAHSAGAKVELRITAKIIQDLNDTSVFCEGKAWIAHGNNVITFPISHENNNYRWIVNLIQAPMGGITPRNVRHTEGLTIFTENESETRGKVRIEGGHGLTSCGWDGTTNFGTTERFDDIANTHTARTTATARRTPAGYSLNGYGFTSCGYATDNVGTTERFDDIADTHTARTDATARSDVAGYSLNGYGFTSCGYITGETGTTERFDDVSNTHTTRTAASARFDIACYSLNGYGFTSCGWNGSTNFGTTEKFDDTANSHTVRAAATPRYGLAGYSLNGYGFTSCGYTSGVIGTTERFDDIVNSHTARTTATARAGLAGYSLNGYGFTSCGYTTTYVGTTERFDDVTNTHTVRTNASARYSLTGYSLNEYFVQYITF